MNVLINEVNLNVQDVNPGGGEIVVMVHGWPLAGAMFEYQVESLTSNAIRAITVDLPGYGYSDRTYDHFNYDMLSDMLLALFEKMNLTNITLLGFSMGGGIAAKYASKHKNGRVKKLVLAGAACPSFVKRDNFPFGMSIASVDKLIASTKEDKPKSYSDFSKLVFETTVSEEFKNWFGSIANLSSLNNAVGGLHALRNEDLREDIKSIEIPTLILHSVKDRVCPFILAEEMKKRIRNSILVPFYNSGHGLFYEEKNKFNSELMKFINNPKANNYYYNKF